MSPPCADGSSGPIGEKSLTRPWPPFPVGRSDTWPPTQGAAMRWWRKEQNWLNGGVPPCWN